MKETRFERNLKAAPDNLNKLYGTYRTVLDMARLFMGGVYIPKFVNEYSIDERKKTAIVLLGYSCSGKTSYAFDFINSHPEFELLSMDECATKEIMENPMKYLYGTQNPLKSDAGIRTFGERIEKGTKLVIDGCWLHINIRCAILKTLRELGYQVIGFSFLNIPQEQYMQRIESRVLQFMAQEKVGGAPTLEPIDWIKEYCEKSGKTRDTVVAELRADKKFEEDKQSEISRIQNEFLTSGIKNQIDSKFVYLGFHQFLDLNG